MGFIDRLRLIEVLLLFSWLASLRLLGELIYSSETSHLGRGVGHSIKSTISTKHLISKFRASKCEVSGKALLRESVRSPQKLLSLQALSLRALR